MSKEKRQVVEELHKPARKNFDRRRTIIRGLGDLWQADLAQMDRYAKDNNKHKFILIVIDCFSKFIWAKALKDKSAREVTEAFSEILSKTKPKNLQTDQGKEFFNKNFQALMKKHGINHYHTYSIKKAAIAERAIRTLKERLFKYFSLNGSYRWIDVLDDFVGEYNKTKHRTIGMKPCDVNEKNEKGLLKTKFNHIKIAGRGRFKVGDVVRISKEKHVFSKGYLPNWTTELFKITNVKITNPITYLLEDMRGSPIRGAFYDLELQKAKYNDVYLVEKVLKKRGAKVLVRWLGLDKSHDSWISTKNKL